MWMMAPHVNDRILEDELVDTWAMLENSYEGGTDKLVALFQQQCEA